MLGENNKIKYTDYFLYITIQPLFTNDLQSTFEVYVPLTLCNNKFIFDNQCVL